MPEYGIAEANYDHVLDPQPEADSLIARLFATFANLFISIGAAFDAFFALFK